jgi:gluconolactonase
MTPPAGRTKVVIVQADGWNWHMRNRAFQAVLTLWLLTGVQGVFAGQANSSIERLSSEIDSLIRPGIEIEKIAGGFLFIEGPVWVSASGEAQAHLLFSDIPGDRVNRWDPETNGVQVVLEPVQLRQLQTGGVGGSNGLILDSDGQLVLFEHGNRRVARLNGDGTRTALVERYEGKRLNSPNDGVYHSSGALFFTDPPYGLPGQDEDSAKELAHNGIYRLDADGSLHLLAQQDRPNGIGFSPDEKTLYVANSGVSERLWMAYEVADDLTLRDGKIFFDASAMQVPGAPDGLVVDRDGNLWATGPGGVLVLSPDGRHLGTIRLPELPANATFDADETTLYMTARTGLYRLRR